MSNIISLNPNLTLNHNVHSAIANNQAKDIGLQKIITDQLSSVIDKSTGSKEIENLMSVADYISTQRPQLYSQFDFRCVSHALEISHDFGNIGRHVAEQVSHLTSIKPSNFYAAIANSLRCSDLGNVTTLCADVKTLVFPKDAYDLIIITDIQEYISTLSQLEGLLQILQEALTEQGCILVTKPNSNSAKHWFDNQADHIPYHALYPRKKSMSLDEAAWQALIGQSQLNICSEYLILPNAMTPRTLLSKSYLKENKAALNHFYGAGLIDNNDVNEYLFFSHEQRASQLFELGNAHLCLLSKGNGFDLAEYDFVHFSNHARQAKWRTVTTKKKTEDVVNKVQLLDKQSSESELFKQNLVQQEFVLGQSLAIHWLHQLCDDDSGVQFINQNASYLKWLKTLIGTKWESSLYDLLPFNIMLDEDFRFHIIDAEWQAKQNIEVEFVFFRAIFWFVVANKSLFIRFSHRNKLVTIQELVEHLCQAVSLTSPSELSSLIAKWVELESSYQQDIEKYFDPNAIHSILNQSVVRDINNIDFMPSAQVFLYKESNGVSAQNSIVQNLTKADVYETLNFDVSMLKKSVDSIRVDPIDCTGVFSLKEIRVINQQNQVLWQTNTKDIINNTACAYNIECIDHTFECFFVANSDDPYFIFSGIPDNTLHLAQYIEIDIAYHTKISALNLHSITQDYQNKTQSLIEQNTQLNNQIDFLSSHLEFIKGVSDNQNEVIEDLRVQARQQEEKEMRAVIGYQQIINHQFHMMKRSPIGRFKSLIERLTGRVLLQRPQLIKEDGHEIVEGSDIKYHHLGQNNEDYEKWIEQQSLTLFDIASIEAEINTFKYKPVFSIVVPVYNIEEEYLLAAVESVCKQVYPYWQLCLVDDASPKPHIQPLLRKLAQLDSRISIQLNDENQGIGGASNDGLKIAEGDYIALLDHDDELSIDALYENAKIINQDPSVGFIYSDEDKITMQGKRVDPFFKPDFSPDLLESTNYICHFSVFKKELIEQIGGFRLGFDGSQDHDLIIRAVTLAEKVVHIPKVLYHWRKVPGSTADAYDSKSYAWEAGRKAVQSLIEQSGQQGEAILGPLKGSYQVKREIIGKPKISIIIPFKDKPELLKQCLDSILQKSRYQYYEIIGVSNQSEQKATFSLMQEYQQAHKSVTFVELNQPFNFSKLCNYGVENSTGEYIVLLNNDIEITSEDWLERLLEHAQRENVGAVGGKLFYPDGRVQHAGVVAGMHGAAGHSHLYFSPEDIGYYGYLTLTRNVSAVTGAMLMVSKEKYKAMGGLDETNLAVAYNDVDFCLSLLQVGYYNVFTPFCQAVHYESASRGYEDNPEKQARFNKERDFFLGKWSDFLAKGDPYFNPNFDLTRHDYSIKLN